MHGTARTIAITFLLAGTAGAGAEARELSAVESYFAARNGARVLTATLDQIRQNPQQYRPFLIEIRGTVTGNARRPDGATLIISVPNAGTYVVEAAGAAAQEPADAGQSVRVLARVPEGMIVNHLLAAAVASEFDAATYEAARPRRATVAKAPAPRHSRRARAARTQLASRGAVAPGASSVLEAYAQAVLYFNRRLSWDEALRIAHSIIGYSNRYGLDARLVMAVVAVESNFNTDAVSRAGAMGLGQLMPGTAADLGVADPWSPEQNLEGATRLLSGHIAKMSLTQPTEEAIKLALACYNAGAGAVKRHKGIPPYRETRNYVKKVTRLYYQMCGQPVPSDAPTK